MWIAVLFDLIHRLIVVHCPVLSSTLLFLCVTRLIGASEENRCPSSIANNLYLQTRSGRCYRFIFMENNGLGDKTYCEQRGGGLVIIKQPVTQTVLGQSLTNFTWTGSRLWLNATDTARKQDWKWVSGKKVSDGNRSLEDGSPRCDLPENRCNASCVCLRLEGQNKWLQTFCIADKFDYGFVCQYETIQETTCIFSASPIPTQTPDSERGAGDAERCPSHIVRKKSLWTNKDRCYQFIFTEKTWFDAKCHCDKQSGSLLTIERPDIQRFLERSLTNVTVYGQRMWIGATVDTRREHDWKWVTGQTVSAGYMNWKEGSPSCYLSTYLCREDCACLMLDEGYKWYTTFCSANDFQYGFICQFEMTQENTTGIYASSPTATSITTILSTEENSTPNTSTTAKKYTPSFNAVSTSVSNTSANIGDCEPCELVSFIKFPSDIAARHQDTCTRVAGGADADCTADVECHTVTSDDDSDSSDVMHNGSRRSRFQSASIHVQGDYSDAETQSFISAESQLDSDSQIVGDQHATPYHVNDSCTSLHVDDNWLDQPLERPVMRPLQISVMPYSKRNTNPN